MPVDLLTATAGDLEKQLNSGKTTSVDLVNAYLDQIEGHDDYLHAVISKPPRAFLVEQAKKLDEERQKKMIRSKLHGIPILVKDNVATVPSLQMGTTAGSLALAGSKPSRNAEIVDRLLADGAIIIAKANLSELSYFKGLKLDCGWSAVGGQTQSPYVRGGFREDDVFDGHSNAGGSSSGSAAGVAAGYAPVSIGTETAGSLVFPAGRAALYTIKPTISIVSQQGIIPITSFCDSAGPMTKSVEDLANLLDVLVDPSKTHIPEGGYSSVVTAKWEGLRIGTLDPEKWQPKFDEDSKREPVAEEQMKVETLEAYEKLKTLTSGMQNHVDLISESALKLDGEYSTAQIFTYDFKRDFEAFLGDLQDSKIRTLEDLIAFNKENAETELPSKNPRQDRLEGAAMTKLTADDYERLIKHARHVARDTGIDETFRKYNINVIVGPIESSLSLFAAAAGYPIASLPLGYLDFNGRPHGLAAIAAAHQEGTLIQLQSAWESSFSARIPPSI